MASRLQDFVEGLDLLPHRIPAEFLDRLIGRVDSEVRDQPPVDRRAPFGLAGLTHMDDGQRESR